MLTPADREAQFERLYREHSAAASELEFGVDSLLSKPLPPAGSTDSQTRTQVPEQRTDRRCASRVV
jgi:hypothetical protein